MSLPRLSVIIVSYECHELLLQCIESLRAESLGDALEIIVIDNASSDGSGELVRSKWPDVRLIQNEENVGFPAANNQGLRIARAPAFLLLNPDTVVTRGALPALLDFLEREPGGKVVGLDIRNPDGTVQDGARRTAPSAAEFILEQVGLGRRPRSLNDGRDPGPGRSHPVASVSGAALAFTRAVSDRIGGLDANMFWAEDMDFCRRAAEAGFPVLHLPGARVVHYGGASGRRNLRRMLYAQHASRITFARRHYGWRAALLLRAAFAMLLPAKMAVRAISLSRPAKRAENRARIAGYWDALRFCLSGR